VEELQRNSPKDLCSKGTEVLKESETKLGAGRSAAAHFKRWKDVRKPSAFVGRRG